VKGILASISVTTVSESPLVLSFPTSESAWGTIVTGSHLTNPEQVLC